MLYNTSAAKDEDFELTQTVKQFLQQNGGDDSLLQSFLSLSVSQRS
jgi:hypothetical protein